MNGLATQPSSFLLSALWQVWYFVVDGSSIVMLPDEVAQVHLADLTVSLYRLASKQHPKCCGQQNVHILLLLVTINNAW